MRNVNPTVFLIGRSTVDLMEISEWMSYLKTTFNIDSNSTPGELLVQLAGKRCYMSFQVGLNPNIQRVREDMGDFIDNILKVGHGSVLEHSVYNFALEGVSRVFSAEMNRHRAGMAISEGSLRFIRFDDIPFWMPDSLQDKSWDSEDLLEKKASSRGIFHEVFLKVERCYAELCEIWKEELKPESKFALKKNITSMLRRIIPLGVATGGVWTGNLRSLRHIFTMRCAPEAEEEILLVASLMLQKMIEAEPLFFKDFHKDEQGYWRPKYVKV